MPTLADAAQHPESRDSHHIRARRELLAKDRAGRD